MGELAFDADRKRMSTLHWVEGRLVAFTKGAPESVVALCTRTLIHGNAVPMTPEERTQILSQSRSFAEQAYRVLAVAMRDIAHQPEHIEVETVEADLTFLGLVAMMDPPHREVPEAISKCRQAGVRVVMITGDHPLTALAIARKIGLVPDQIARFVPAPFTALGTDGYGLSDTRAALRRHFEVDASHIVVTALHQLARAHVIDARVVDDAIQDLELDREAAPPRLR